MTDEQKKGAENTLRVATNLAVMLSDKDVYVPTKYAGAVLEAQQLVDALIKDLKNALEASKIVAAASSTPAVEAEVVKP